MSRTPSSQPADRALAGLALPAAAGLVLGLGALLARFVVTTGAELSPATSVDELVVLAVCAMGLVLALWLGIHLVVGTVCAFGAACGQRWRAGERLVAAHGPGLVRRGVALAVGASVGLGGIAMANADVTEPVDLGWVPTTGIVTPVGANEQDETSDPDESHDEGEGDGAEGEALATAAPPAPRAIHVEPGDSLWSLTEGLLGSPTATDVATAWPALYAANRAVIGNDPDLIHPGQELVVPASLEEQP